MMPKASQLFRFPSEVGPDSRLIICPKGVVLPARPGQASSSKQPGLIFVTVATP